MATFTGTLNIKLVEAVCLKENDSKNLDLFVSIDEQTEPIYQASTSQKNSKLTFNECFSSEVKDGEKIKFTIFNDAPKSADDFIANCSLSIEDIQKKEKENGVYDLWYDLEPKGSIHFVVEFIESKENSRRHSVLRKKLHQVNGHKFQATLLSQPSYCSCCNEFIYGIGLQGYKCTLCNSVVHKRCHKNVSNKCKGIKLVFSDDEEEKLSAKHEFSDTHFLKPTFCQHCGTMIYGMYKQGVKCKGCNLNAHRRCTENVPENCSIKTDQMAIEVN